MQKHHIFIVNITFSVLDHDSASESHGNLMRATGRFSNQALKMSDELVERALRGVCQARELSQKLGNLFFL